MEASESRRRRGHLILVPAGAGVMASLVFLPWHRYAISVRGAGSFRLDQNGLHAPPEWLGWAALVGAAAVVAGAAVGLALTTRNHRFGPQWDVVVTLVSLAVACLLAGKFLEQTDYLAAGAWISLVLGVVIAAGGLSLRTRGG